jgi:HEAT repeat protein
MQQVRAMLDPEEPDYNKAKQLGPDALVHLENLVRGTDPMLASKAAYLASLIKDKKSAAIVKEAARDARPVVRVAAAAAARNLSQSEASDVLLSLLADNDTGVRKTALKSVPSDASTAVRKKIDELVQKDNHQAIRELSKQTLKKLHS